MLGNLPQQTIDTPFEYNGIQGWLGVWQDESGNFLKVVVENVKGGGKYGSGDSGTWTPIVSDIDPEFKITGTEAEMKVKLTAALNAKTELLKTHVGLAGAVTPPFPAKVIDQIAWLVKYSTTFNPATGKFTVA
jgi:hypothetical protein